MPALEEAYRRFLERVHEETADPGWNIRNHPARPILERYRPEFSGWVQRLMEILLWKRAGYPLDKNALRPWEWHCLAWMERHFAESREEPQGNPRQH